MLNENGFLNGFYEISYEFDGKPSYVNDDYAIWYYSSSSLWMISNIESIGQSSAFLYAYDGFSGLTDINNEWNYYFEGNWVTSSPNYINVTCKNVGTTSKPICTITTTTTDAVTPLMNTTTLGSYIEYKS